MRDGRAGKFLLNTHQKALDKKKGRMYKAPPSPLEGFKCFASGAGKSSLKNKEKFCDRADKALDKDLA